MNPEIEKELEKLKIELDIAQARYDLASHFAGMDKPKPENFPDGWETEWQPSFDAATPEPKPAQEMTANDFQLLEGEAGELLRQPATPENIARIAAIEAILQSEEARRKIYDDAAMGYYQLKIDAEEKNMIARQAIEKKFNDKWTVERRNQLLADAYIANIDLEETHAAYDAAFKAYQEYIFNRDYVIPPGHAANNLSTLYDNRTVLID